MCWSADGSLATYTLAMFLAAIHKGIGVMDPSMWALRVVYSHMQLVEYFLWKNLDVPDRNKFWSGVGLFLLAIQPIIASMMLPVALRNKFLVMYTTFVASYFLTNKVNLTTEVGGNGHLKWNWLPSLFSPWALIWLGFVLAPIYHMGLSVHGAIITYFISAYFNDKYGTAGSYWCWFAIAGWILSFFVK